MDASSLLEACAAQRASTLLVPLLLDAPTRVDSSPPLGAYVAVVALRPQKPSPPEEAQPHLDETQPLDLLSALAKPSALDAPPLLNDSSAPVSPPAPATLADNAVVDPAVAVPAATADSAQSTSSYAAGAREVAPASGSVDGVQISKAAAANPEVMDPGPVSVPVANSVATPPVLTNTTSNADAGLDVNTEAAAAAEEILDMGTDAVLLFVPRQISDAAPAKESGSEANTDDGATTASRVLGTDASGQVRHWQAQKKA